MAENDFCQYCEKKDSCKSAYEKIGNLKGPSVIRKVITALVLPMIMFIGSLIIFELVLARIIETKGLKIALSFLPALAVTLITILIIARPLAATKKN